MAAQLPYEGLELAPKYHEGLQSLPPHFTGKKGKYNEYAIGSGEGSEKRICGRRQTTFWLILVIVILVIIVIVVGSVGGALAAKNQSSAAGSGPQSAVANTAPFSLSTPLPTPTSIPTTTSTSSSATSTPTDLAGCPQIDQQNLTNADGVNFTVYCNKNCPNNDITYPGIPSARMLDCTNLCTQNGTSCRGVVFGMDLGSQTLCWMKTAININQDVDATTPHNAACAVRIY